MENPLGRIELAVGTLDRRGNATRDRLVSEGWILFAAGENAAPLRILSKATGKENAIVCLDEAEGTFLLLLESRR